MTYTTTRTITLPSSALWTQVEAAVREVGGSVGEAGTVPAWLAAITGRNLDQDPACQMCGSPLEPVPDAGMVCVREGCRP